MPQAVAEVIVRHIAFVLNHEFAQSYVLRTERCNIVVCIYLHHVGLVKDHAVKSGREESALEVYLSHVVTVNRLHADVNLELRSVVDNLDVIVTVAAHIIIS